MRGSGWTQFGRGGDSVADQVQAGVGREKLAPHADVDRRAATPPGGEDVGAGGLGRHLLGDRDRRGD